MSAHADRGSLLPPVKAALILFLAAPSAWFVAGYLWAHHGVDGIAMALISNTGDGILAAITLFVHDPMRAVLHMAFMSMITRIAWR